jgi:hypothetical protein
MRSQTFANCSQGSRCGGPGKVPQPFMAFRVAGVANMVVSICLSMVTNRAGQGQGRVGQGGQGSHCEGPSEVPFLIKKSLGKTKGPASNQTKIQIF